MTGALDEVVVYGTALTAARVSAHYSAAAAVDVPSNFTPPAIAGEVALGDTLTAKNGSWSYRPAFTHQWRRCDGGGSNCTSIAGATSPTYVVTSAEVGRTIRVDVTATSSAGSALASSAQTRSATVNRLRDQPAYDLAVLPDNPWGYWSLEESAGTVVADRSGNNQPLAMNVRSNGGTPQWGAPGPAIDTTALHLRGNTVANASGDQVAGVLSGASSTEFMDNFTAELWVKTHNTGNFLIGLGNPYRCCTTTGWTLMLKGERQLSVVIGGAIRFTGPKIPDNLWTHVALARSSGTWQVFLNGRQVGSFLQAATAPAGAGARFWIGNDDWSGSGPGLKGDVAYAAFYKSVLGADRLLAHYKALAPSVVSTKQTMGVPGDGGTLAVNPTGYQADPVNTATGSFFSETTDLALSGARVPFEFTRTYNSGDTRVGRLGQGWSDNLDWTVSIEADGGALVRAGSGQELHYTKLADGSFSADGGGRATLAAIGTTGHELVTTDQIHYVFDTQGRLTSVLDRNAQGLALTYNASGLTTVTDSSGRSVGVTISGGRITGVTLPGGAGSVAFGYTNGLLAGVTDSRGGVTQYTYGTGSRLATVVDQNNVTVLTNTYDATSGRVTDQMDARGKHTTFAWDPATQVSTVTDPNGEVWKDYYADNVLLKQEPPTGDATVYVRDGNLNLAAVAAPSGEQTAMSYDDNGNVLSATAPPSLGNVRRASPTSRRTTCSR